MGQRGGNCLRIGIGRSSSLCGERGVRVGVGRRPCGAVVLEVTGRLGLEVEVALADSEGINGGLCNGATCRASAQGSCCRLAGQRAVVCSTSKCQLNQPNLAQLKMAGLLTDQVAVRLSHKSQANKNRLHTSSTQAYGSERGQGGTSSEDIACTASGQGSCCRLAGQRARSMQY